MSKNLYVEKRKWIRKEGLNKKGKELVDLFDKIQNADSTDREIYRFYIQNKLKFNIETFDNYTNAKELEFALLSLKNYQISKKEQLEDAVDFIIEQIKQWGIQIHILVNNAGFNECGYFRNTDL